MMEIMANLNLNQPSKIEENEIQLKYALDSIRKL